MATKRKRRNHGYENQSAALRAAMGTTRRNSAVPVGDKRFAKALPMPMGNPHNPRRRSRVSEAPDEHAITDLVLYAENSAELYPMMQSVRKALLTRMRRGDYDILKSGKAWFNVMNRAAQLYTREFGTPGPHGSYGVFSVGTRSAAAGRMQSQFSTEAATGELDYLLPKKYQRKNTAHYPRTTRGRKGTAKWFILDLFSASKQVSSRYKRVSRASATSEAQSLVGRRVGGHIIRRVELSGPYSHKPNAHTTRK